MTNTPKTPEALAALVEDNVQLQDHLCRGCGGRVVRYNSHGPTGGGNPVWGCANCGNRSSDMGPECVCWCGFSHRNNNENPYTCLPFSILTERPELLSAFLSCGCDPERGVVGIVLTEQLRRKT